MYIFLFYFVRGFHYTIKHLRVEYLDQFDICDLIVNDKAKRFEIYGIYPKIVVSQEKFSICVN